MTATRRYVLCPVGSAGDVFPFIAVGRALARRGREVLLVVSENFGPAAAQAGLPFAALGSAEDFERVKAIPDLWHPRRGFGVVMKLVAEGMREAYAKLEELVDPRRDVLAMHILALSARVHQEVHGTAGSTLHLAPTAYRSEFAQPTMLPGLNLDLLPRFLKRTFWWLVDRCFLDPAIAPELDAWRAELGLGPVRRVFRDWIHAEDGTIALFPASFGPRQPDWPEPFAHAGFPVWDGDNRLDPALETWLEAGPPPLVFTPGSANLHSEDFGRAAAGAARLLGLRALYLAADSKGFEVSEEAGLRHAPWAPLGRVMERAAALVHHGGIGTTARGLLSGRPQLIMPMGFDQPDNAARVKRMGRGSYLKPRDFEAARVADELRGLLEDAAVGAADGDGEGAERAAEILIRRHEG